MAVVNFTLAAGADVSPANPRTDYQGSFDYFHTLDKRGTAFFLGLQHEASAGKQTIGSEEGLVIPFRNGQVEPEAAQLDLSGGPQIQFQARVIINWGRVLSGTSRIPSYKLVRLPAPEPELPETGPSHSGVGATIPRTRPARP